MLRKIIQNAATVAMTIGFIAGGVLVAKKLAGSKPTLPKSSQALTATVFVRTVQNGAVPVQIRATGALQALDRVDLYAEVQGVMLPDGGKFKAGSRFKKDETLVAINSEDYRAQLVSQRSNLLNLITAALADLRLDFPESFEKWNMYAKQFDIESAIAPLPEPSSDQEKLFVSGRNILSTYYSIKNAEIVLGKYQLSAPFNGVLTEATVTPGTVIRPGQKLGTFIDPTIFEMEVPVNVSAMKYISIGQKVTISSTDHQETTWQGTVSRINNVIDPTTQTRNVYLQVSGNGLEEGMYLEASIAATSVNNAIELPRSVLMNGNEVYTTDGSVLIKQNVEPVFFTESTVVVRGLPNGAQVLTRMPPSAYPGMQVKTVSED